MTELVQDLAWQADALELRATTELTTSEIGNRVDKHPATIRKLFARNPPPVADPTADRAMSTEEANAAFSAISMTPTPVDEQHEGTIPGQTTVDDFTDTCEHGVPLLDECETCDPQVTPPPTPDDWENWEPGAKEAFKSEAGEAVGPMPPVVTVTREMDGGEEVVAVPQIKGTAQLALDFGPDAAMVTSATVVFKSEKLTSGYFEMGDVIHGTFTARITAITGAEKLDKDLDVFVAKPQAQVATITEIEVF